MIQAPTTTSRRAFLKGATSTASLAAFGGCRSLCCCGCERLPYDDTIGDRLWMWGHHAMSFAAMKKSKTTYNLPYDRRIDMAAACREMNIPGCFVVRWLNMPNKAELPEYMKQFAATKRVGFSITDGAVESFDEKVRLGLEYADKMPNLTTFIMDDYWSGANKGGDATIDAIRSAKQRMAERRLKLGVVLYSDSNGVKDQYRDVLDLCDEVTFWFWNGKNTASIEEQVAKLRALIGPEKPVLLGQYMWDFGGKKPMPGAAMENQLAQTSRLLARREIHGVIFHCTPLVDMNLDAVNISKAWIKDNAAKPWGEKA